MFKKCSMNSINNIFFMMRQKYQDVVRMGILVYLRKLCMENNILPGTEYQRQ